MPRGYLKHNKNISKKAARGGASHSSYDYPSPKRYTPVRRSCLELSNYVQQEIESCKAWSRGYRKHNQLISTKAASSGATHGSYHRPLPKKCMRNSRSRLQLSSFIREDTFGIGNLTEEGNSYKRSAQCSICCEVVPLVKLFKKCSHPSACQECLRRMCIVDSMLSVRNYPLRCFHPSCGLVITKVQLKAHSLVRTQEELTKHHRMMALSKCYRAKDISVVHCPSCDHPRKLKSLHADGDSNLRLFVCTQCKTRYALNNGSTAHGKAAVDYSTVQAIESLNAIHSVPMTAGRIVLDAVY